MQYQLITGSDYVLMSKGDIISTIPNDPANIDWQDYQAWLADGNEPEPAE